MKYSLLLPFGLATTAGAHSIFQGLSVDGVDQGRFNGMRVPEHDEPIMDPTDPAFSCNLGWRKPINTKVITIPAGAKVGCLWGHVNGGAQFPGDPAEPIHDSHRGPIHTYLSKVEEFDDSPTADFGPWFKVAEDAYDPATKLWGVDRMRANKGWSYFTMPTCIASGTYWLRQHLEAFHSTNKPQFYMTCARVTVTGSTGTLTPQTVRLQDVMKLSDPSLTVNIYRTITDYVASGPRPIVCDGSATGPASANSTGAAAYPTEGSTTGPASADSTEAAAYPADNDTAAAVPPEGNSAEPATEDSTASTPSSDSTDNSGPVLYPAGNDTDIATPTAGYPTATQSTSPDGYPVGPSGGGAGDKATTCTKRGRGRCVERD